MGTLDEQILPAGTHAAKEACATNRFPFFVRDHEHDGLLTTAIRARSLSLCRNCGGRCGGVLTPACFATNNIMTNALTRWDPFREMEDLHSRLSTILSRPSNQRGNSEGNRESLTVAEWAPLVDITEDDKEYLINIEIPGIRKEDVKVAVENGVLAITGERKLEKEEKDKKTKYHRIERAYGTFVRTFTMPDDGDPTKVAAEFRDGMLTVRIPKSEHAKPKQIEVKVA